VKNSSSAVRSVFLDFASVDLDQDLNRDALLKALPHLEFYSYTSDSELLERLKGTEVVLTNSVTFSAELLRQLPSLKFIGLTATGYNHIDVKAAKSLGIAVTHLKDYCTQSVVQHAFAGLLCLNQHLLKLDQQVRLGHWDNKSPGRIRELPGQTLGIIGHGVLGQAMASMAIKFGMSVLVGQRPGKPNSVGVPLTELLAIADVVSLHVPLNEQTRGLIGYAELQRMQRHAILINVSRGAVVDAIALANALRNRTIGGAFIDVFDPEPPPPDHPLLATDLSNIVLSPHLAWGSFEARQRAIDELAANVTAFYAGESRLRVV
jgi:glycerate dehydrogenase